MNAPSPCHLAKTRPCQEGTLCGNAVRVPHEGAPQTLAQGFNQGLYTFAHSVVLVCWGNLQNARPFIGSFGGSILLALKGKKACEPAPVVGKVGRRLGHKQSSFA